MDNFTRIHMSIDDLTEARAKLDKAKYRMVPVGDTVGNNDMCWKIETVIQVLDILREDLVKMAKEES